MSKLHKLTSELMHSKPSWFNQIQRLSSVKWRSIYLHHFLLETDSSVIPEPIKFFYVSPKKLSSIIQKYLNLIVSEEEQNDFSKFVLYQLYELVCNGSVNIIDDAYESLYQRSKEPIETIPILHIIVLLTIETIWLKESYNHDDEEAKVEEASWHKKLGKLIERFIGRSVSTNCDELGNLFIGLQQKLEVLSQRNLTSLPPRYSRAFEELGLIDSTDIQFQWKRLLLPDPRRHTRVGYVRKLAFPSWRDEKKISAMFTEREQLTKYRERGGLEQIFLRNYLRNSLRQYIDNNIPHVFSSFPTVFEHYDRTANDITQMEPIWDLVTQIADEADYAIAETKSADFSIFVQILRDQYRIWIVCNQEKNIELSADFSLQSGQLLTKVQQGKTRTSLYKCILLNHQYQYSNDECIDIFLQNSWFSDLEKDRKSGNILLECIDEERNTYLARRPPYTNAKGLRLTTFNVDGAKWHSNGWSLIHTDLPVQTEENKDQAQKNNVNVHGLKLYRQLVGYPWLRTKFTTSNDVSDIQLRHSESTNSYRLIPLQSTRRQRFKSLDDHEFNTLEDTESEWTLPLDGKSIAGAMEVYATRNGQSEYLSTFEFTNSFLQTKDLPTPRVDKYVPRADEEQSIYLSDKLTPASCTPRSIASFWALFDASHDLHQSFFIPLSPRQNSNYNSHYSTILNELQKTKQPLICQPVNLPNYKQQNSIVPDLENALMVLLQGKRNGIKLFGAYTNNGSVPHVHSLFYRAISFVLHNIDQSTSPAEYCYPIINSWEEAGYIDTRQPFSRFVSKNSNFHVKVSPNVYGKRPALLVYRNVERNECVAVLTGTITPQVREQCIRLSIEKNIRYSMQHETGWLSPPRLILYAKNLQVFKELDPINFPVQRLQKPIWNVESKIEQWYKNQITAKGKNLYWDWENGKFTSQRANNDSIVVIETYRKGQAPYYGIQLNTKELHLNNSNEPLILYDRSRRDILFAAYLLRQHFRLPSTGHGIYLPLQLARYLTATSEYTSGVLLNSQSNGRHVYGYAWQNIISPEELIEVNFSNLEKIFSSLSTNRHYSRYDSDFEDSESDEWDYFDD